MGRTPIFDVREAWVEMSMVNRRRHTKARLHLRAQIDFWQNSTPWSSVGIGTLQFYNTTQGIDRNLKESVGGVY